MLTILLALAFPFTPQAEINGKFDIVLADLSRTFEMGEMPSEPMKTTYLPDGRSGELDKDTVPNYRHMHAFVATAFYAKKKKEREVALKWLGRYQCENWVACRDLEQVYSAAMKANVLTMKKETKEKYSRLRKKIEKDLKLAEQTRPKEMGVCDPSATTNPWLELEYQILCPYRDLGTDVGFAEDTPAEKQLAKKLAYDSGQLSMSSSYLKSVRHIGQKHCLKPWETKIRCGGSAELEITFACETAEKERKVTCKKHSTHQNK